MCHLKLPDTPAYDSLPKKPCTDVRCRYVGRTFVKVAGKPTDILEKLNEMAGFTPNEEIQLYEVWFFRSSNSSMNVLLSFLGIIFQEFFCKELFFHFVQEIKFEPNVMCEPVDKKFTFKASQVYEGQRDLTREMGTRFS